MKLGKVIPSCNLNFRQTARIERRSKPMLRKWWRISFLPSNSTWPRKKSNGKKLRSDLKTRLDPSSSNLGKLSLKKTGNVRKTVRN